MESRLERGAERARAATPRGTISQSGCSRTTWSAGRGRPKWAARSTFTHAWTRRLRERARSISRDRGSKLGGCGMSRELRPTSFEAQIGRAWGRERVKKKVDK